MNACTTYAPSRDLLEALIEFAYEERPQTSIFPYIDLFRPRKAAAATTHTPAPETIELWEHRSVHTDFVATSESNSLTVRVPKIPGTQDKSGPETVTPHPATPATNLGTQSRGSPLLFQSRARSPLRYLQLVLHL